MGLFKYYDDGKFDLAFIESGLSMRLSQASALNDPFEAKLDIKSTMERKSKAFLINKAPTKDQTILIKSIIQTQTEKSELEFREGVNKNYGILSLTTNQLNRLMWSHYTNSYRGFCIELDLDYDEKEVIHSEEFGYRTYTKKVNYKNKPIAFNPFIERLGKGAIGLYAINILSLKDDIWEYEDEYRIIGLLLNKESSKKVAGIPLFTITFPPEKVKQIIFGTECSEENINKVRSWISLHDAHHIKLSRVVMHNDNFSLYAKPLTLFQSDAQSTHRQGRSKTKHCINIQY